MKIKLFLFLSLCGLFTTAFTSDFGSMPQSFGAPVSSTGAPEEVTCAESECHDTSPVNIGTASTTFHMEGVNNGMIESGKTYPVRITVTDENVNRFGFQVVAIDSKGNNTGTFIITEKARTQIMKNDLRLTDRRYVTYTYEGTEAVQKGKGEWTINWQAPEQSTDVTFYVATVSANNDGTDKGDFVYTTSRNYKVMSVSGINNETIAEDNLFISPNPTDGDMISVNVPTLFVNTETRYEIVGLNGERYIPNTVLKNTPTSVLCSVNNIPSGYYRLQLIGKDNTISIPFIITR